jgi:hypothetical protein
MGFLKNRAVMIHSFEHHTIDLTYRPLIKRDFEFYEEFLREKTQKLTVGNN